MQSSAQSEDKLEAQCVNCGQRFVTTQFRIFRNSFPADRYCAVCRAAEAAEDAQKRADILWGQARIPREFSNARFDNFTSLSGNQHALSSARKWAQADRMGSTPRRGLLFFGPPGSGKTHLAVAILAESVYGRHCRALFINVPDWLNAIRESWDGEGQPPNPDGYELIVIDDLGAEH